MLAVLEAPYVQYYNVNVAVADPIKLLRPSLLSMYVRTYVLKRLHFQQSLNMRKGSSLIRTSQQG